MAHLNLIKLSVGSKSVASLVDWQQTRRAQSEDGLPRHVTRMWPKRAEDILAGGSLYWVIKGVILCRQQVMGLEEVIRAAGLRRCAILLDPEITRTAPAPRRPFQGWRYLNPEDAPPDLSAGAQRQEALPPDLERALSDIGIL